MKDKTALSAYASENDVMDIFANESACLTFRKLRWDHSNMQIRILMPPLCGRAQPSAGGGEESSNRRQDTCLK